MLGNWICEGNLLTVRGKQKVHSKVEELIAKDEWHDRPFIAALGCGGEQEEAMKAFVRSRL